MNNKKESELLKDILNLLKKYGPDVFENLARVLSSPTFGSHLPEILIKSAQAFGSRRLKEPKPGRLKQIDSILSGIKDSNPAKAEALREIYDGASSKDFLPTLKNIKALASDLGLPALKAKSRKEAILPLIRLLSSLQESEIKSVLLSLKRTASTGNRSLEGWSNIILKDR